MTTTEYDILFNMLMKVVDLMNAQTKQVSNVVNTIEQLSIHCLTSCDGKCGTSHEG